MSEAASHGGDELILGHQTIQVWDSERDGLGWGCRFERVGEMLSINESENLSLGR